MSTNPGVIAELATLEAMQIEPVAFGLYRAINDLMATLGSNGSIDSDDACAHAVMDELYKLDGGKVAKRIDDLIGKGGMPLAEATELAISEYAAASRSFFLGISDMADFTTNTWTFRMEPGYKVSAGTYMITKVPT